MKPAETAIPRSDPPALPASSNSAAASLCLAILKLLSRLLDAILLGIAGILFLLGLLALADNARIYAEADSRVYQACRPAGTRSGFAALHSRNPEVLGWISIPGTKIDYPFVQGSDNREYANLSPERKFSLAGSLFLDSRNAPDCSDFNTLLYGHHMDHDEMLGGLDHYRELSYFDRHREGTIYLDSHEYRLEFFGLLEADAYDSAIYAPAVPPAQAERYLELLQSRAVRWIPEAADASDHLLILSTCADGRTNARLLLVGRILPGAASVGSGKVVRSLSAARRVPWLILPALCFLAILLGRRMRHDGRMRRRQRAERNAEKESFRS